MLGNIDEYALYDKIHNLGARALLLREFWKSSDTEHDFFFDSNNTDVWIKDKKAQYEILISDRKIIDNTDDDTEYHHRIGELSANLNKEEFYRSTIYTSSEGEYTIEIQDDMIECLLQDIFEKFDTKTNLVDIFTLVRTDDISEYKARVNGLLSILRLEYGKKIKVYDFGHFYEDSMEFSLRFERGPLWQDNSQVKRDIFLDEKNGDVFLKGKKQGTIRNNTQQYYFFSYLYAKYDKPITHRELYDFIKENNMTIEKYSDSFCTHIKKRLPEGIRVLIKSSRGHYQLGSN